MEGQGGTVNEEEKGEKQGEKEKGLLGKNKIP